MAITVAPTVEAAADGLPPRVRLNISVSAGEASVTPIRVDADGQSVPVRTASGDALALTGTSAILYDYEAPFGLPVYYSSLENIATVSSAVTVSESRIWLVHPGIPTLSTPIELAAGSMGEEEFGVAQGVFSVMGRAEPLVFTDGTRRSGASTLLVLVESSTQLRALKSILQDTGTLLLNIPDSLGLGVGSCYIAVGSVRNRRPSDIGSDPLRVVELPYMVVRRPAGGSQATRTWVDVKLDFGTWADVKAAYRTWFDVLAGP